MSESNSKPVIVRFPPSPTGFLHIGNVRTMVFNYLFAKQNGGKIIYRSEDTDLARSENQYEEYIKEAFSWLGLEYDEFYRQSERSAIYREQLEKLIAEDKAYISKEEPTADELAIATAAGKTLSSSVIRLRNPGTVVTFNDIVLGDIATDTTDLGDFIIAKDLDHAIYHFTVVADDYLMGITHIIRGADHIANTPRQILIQEALGAPRPIYAHAPLVLGGDGQKMSKRHGATKTLDYRDVLHIEADALINFLALTGWNPGTEQEIFTREDLIKTFSLERIQKSPAIFNEEKMRWINKQHLNKLSEEEKFNLVKPDLSKMENYTGDTAKKIIPVIFERIETLGEFREFLKAGEYDFYFSDPAYDEPEKIVWKKSDNSSTQEHLSKVLQILSPVAEWSKPELEAAIFPYAESAGKGDVLWPLRFALSGKDKSPDPFTILEILGKEVSMRRITQAQQALASML